MSAPRPLPRLDDLNRAFWTGGGRGELLIQACAACEYLVHPPSVTCPRCGRDEPQPRPVSGTGTVVAVSVNHQPWVPGLETPYVIALVELDEQPGLRLTTNIVGCEPHKAGIGMRVQVTFERCGEIFVPLFSPMEVAHESDG